MNAIHDETRADTFKRLAEQRKLGLDEWFRKLGNLANTNNYDYNEDDVDGLISRILDEVEKLDRKFKQGLIKQRRRQQPIAVEIESIKPEARIAQLRRR